MSATIPEHGADPDDILRRLDSFRAHDVSWQDGKAFSLTYSAGPTALRLAKEAYSAYSSENMLNLDAFPSLRQMQSEVISIVAVLLGGDNDTVGVFTSGGTESILTAVHGAKNWGRARGIEHPRMVLPTTAHAAFSKAAAYFDVEAVRVPVGPDFRADPRAMEAVIDDQTVLVVASAPAYPQGVIDPVADIAAIAANRDVLCHVDACMGFTLPWLQQLGEIAVPWNLAVGGVTSISCDLHKFGYAAKGAGVLLHRDKTLRRHQLFVTSDWLGGLYGSPAVLGTRSGGGLASAWAVLHHLGAEGYRSLAADAIAARREIQQGIEAIPALAVRGRPDATLIAFGAADPSTLDIFAVADLLWSRHGWYVDRQTPPDSLHLTVNAIHRRTAANFIADLAAVVGQLQAHGGPAGDRTRAYGTVE